MYYLDSKNSSISIYMYIYNNLSNKVELNKIDIYINENGNSLKYWKIKTEVNVRINNKQRK